ncbi:MAG: hypothetical protein ACRC9P_05270, partial [Bacteroides sp.]
NYLIDVKNLNISDSLCLNYINSKIIPQGSDINTFITDLNPWSFKVKGGNRGTSDIADVLKTILLETKDNDIAILVTDGIFSPGRGEPADAYLDRQQTEIKDAMSEYLNNYPNTAVVLYQLSSQFNGIYYNLIDRRISINEQRPYYMWIIGNIRQVNKLLKNIPEANIKGGGVQHSFSIVGGNMVVDYAISRGSGNFKLDRHSPKNTIVDLRKDTKGRAKEVRFSVDVNLSNLLLDDSYLTNRKNYELNPIAYKLTIASAPSNKKGFTHRFTFSSPNVHKGIFKTRLLYYIPEWVYDTNDDDGTTAVSGKTYGIKHQVLGVYEAYTLKNNYYTEFNINVK